MLFPTANGLAKSILDAVEGVRDLLAESGVHDFELQEPGRRGRVTEKALLGTEGVISRASMYRPATKEGAFTRIWFSGLERYAAPDDALALVVDETGEGATLHVYNLTSDQGLEGEAAEGVVVQPPVPRARQNQRQRPRLARGPAPRADEQLGLDGEEWVVEFERARLRSSGRPDLAEQVEWVAQTRGDGDGYDISSFEVDGSSRFIEVKTTRGGKRAAFIITANEVRASRELGDQFWLYRVFDFDGERRLWMRNGPVDAYCDLSAVQFRAKPW